MIYIKCQYDPQTISADKKQALISGYKYLHWRVIDAHILKLKEEKKWYLEVYKHAQVRWEHSPELIKFLGVDPNIKKILAFLNRVDSHHELVKRFPHLIGGNQQVRCSVTFPHTVDNSTLDNTPKY